MKRTPPPESPEVRKRGEHIHRYLNKALGERNAELPDEAGPPYGEDEEGNELAAAREKREKWQRRRRARRRLLAGFLLFLLLLGGIWLNVGTLAPQAVSARFGGLFDIFGYGKSNFPVSIDQGTFQTAVPVGSDLGVLTDTTFLLYAQNGRLLSARPQGLTSPAAAACGPKAVVYDHGGKQLRVETRFGEPFTLTSEEPITGAAGGKNGYFAVITQSEDYLSELTVYDNAYKNVFRWDCAQGRILCAALDDSGKNLAAVVMGARNGTLFSDIYFFRLSDKTPYAVRAYDGEIFYSLLFRGDGSVSAVGENKTVFLSGGKQTAAYGYGNRELLQSCNAEPLLLVFGGVNGHTAAVSLGGDGKALGQADLPGTPEAMASGDGRALFAVDGRLYAAAQNLKSLKAGQSASGVSALIAQGDQAYLFGARFISRCTPA